MHTKLNAILLTAVLLPFAAPAAEEAKKETPEDQHIREYILRNPEIIVQALQVLQLKQKLALQQQTKGAIVAQQAALFHDPDSPAAGAGEDGGITIVEFFDYHCGYCKRVAPTVDKLLKSNPKVRIVYKEFPILGPESELAAKAALAARKQGAYLKLHQALLELAGPITLESIAGLAKELAIDAERLKADMESAEVRAALEANQKLAAAVGVQSTPSFVAGSELVAGALDEATFAALVARVSEKSAAAIPAAGGQ